MMDEDVAPHCFVDDGRYESSVDGAIETSYSSPEIE